jgi:spermidine synthase
VRCYNIVVLFRPKVIGKFHSDYSGTIRVVQGWGFRHLSTNKIQQSGGIVGEIWTKSLKNRVDKYKSWLVLGVAGGTVLKIISRKYSPTRIMGIDIDPVIVDVGRKFFGLDKIPNTQIIIADAEKYIQKTSEHFDYILVDLFGVDGPPQFIYKIPFLKRLKVVGTKVFINNLHDTPEHIQSAHQIHESLVALGFSVRTTRILANSVIIC